MKELYFDREARIALALVLAVVVLAVSLSKAPTTFSISVKTQYAGFRASPAHRARWYFDNAEMKRGPVGTMEPLTGAIKVMPGALVSLERVGSGPLRLRVKTSGDAVAALVNPVGQAPFDVVGQLVVVAQETGDRHSTVLPFIGADLELGAEITNAENPTPVLLLGGSVTLLAHTMTGEQRYDAGKVALDLGDSIALDEVGDAAGILSIGAHADLAATVRVIARSLRVNRYGALGYEVYATPLVRLQKDTALQALWGSALLVFGLLAKLGKKAADEKGKNA